jgi:hypothetical protein
VSTNTAAHWAEGEQCVGHPRQVARALTWVEGSNQRPTHGQYIRHLATWISAAWQLERLPSRSLNRRLVLREVVLGFM